MVSTCLNYFLKDEMVDISGGAPILLRHGYITGFMPSDHVVLKLGLLKIVVYNLN
jgi:hypothetical protein